MTFQMFVQEWLWVMGFISTVALFATAGWWVLSGSHKTPQAPVEVKPVIDEILIWYEGQTKPLIYMNVAEAFVFTNNNLLRITHDDGSKVYVALNQKGFLRLNIHYKEDEVVEEHEWNPNDDLDE